MRVAILGAISSKEDTGRNPSQVVVDYISNIHKMAVVAGRLRKLGHAPFCPAIDFLLGAINGDWTEEDYRGLTNAFIPACDCALVISDSWGAQKDVELSTKFGIPIHYRIEDIPGE